MVDLKYPIGQWVKPDEINFNMIQKWIYDISILPDQLEALANERSSNELEKSYRQEGWNVRQLIHHLADSHINAYLRHKLCFTSDTPTINPYKETEWAILEDVKVVPVEVSMQLLAALHLRWSTFLYSVGEADMQKAFIHPQHNRLIKLEESIGMYSWHGRHHLEHINIALKSK